MVYVNGDEYEGEWLNDMVRILNAGLNLMLKNGFSVMVVEFSAPPIEERYTKGNGYKIECTVKEALK